MMDMKSRSLPASSFINNQIPCKTKMKNKIINTVESVLTKETRIYLSRIFNLISLFG